MTSFFGFKLANKIGNELDLQTVGQIAKKMTREHYIQSRRDPKTVNKKEVEELLTKWFIESFDIDKVNS